MVEHRSIALTRTLMFGVMLLLLGCAEAVTKSSALKTASQKYQATQDYESLVILSEALKKGMPQAEVEALLGKPAFSPAEGQAVYSSDARMETDGPPATLGLILSYRDTDRKLHDTLQSIYLGPFGE